MWQLVIPRVRFFRINVVNAHSDLSYGHQGGGVVGAQPLHEGNSRFHLLVALTFELIVDFALQ